MNRLNEISPNMDENVPLQVLKAAEDQSYLSDDSLNDLDELVGNLSWDMPLQTQKEAMHRLAGIDDDRMQLLIRPGDKSCWENAARILRNIGYPRNHKVIPGLMAWLQDMNWPGAEIVMEILESIDRKTLIPYIEDSLEKVADDDDFLWITAIKELVTGLQMPDADFHNETYELLKLAEC